MRLPCLIGLSLLASMCAAQTTQLPSPQQPSTSASPADKALSSSTATASKARARLRIFPLQRPVYRENSSLQQDDWNCLSIESYRFSRSNPQSDAVRLVDHSTCTDSGQFELKAAVDPPR